MATTNRLAEETSPYLLQHAHNPVDWYAWGEDAFRTAREADKPILLSVGYSACHWCHVMAHESFENEAIAKLMNEGFVNIKVDREERPDVDQLYQGVVQLMGRGGGWPLTVFLTPDLRPFFGGTYFPAEDRYGMPGFARLLESVREAWRTRRSELLNSAADFQRGLRDLMAYGIGARADELSVGDIARAGERLADEVDFENGGFGGAPKFPNPMSVALMLRASRRGASPDTLAGALLTLDRMAQGGIYDQLGGGFHRYSVDAYWAVPHFEKMLYDNAQLLHLYTEGWQLTRSPLYARVVEETIAYVQREMTSPEGGFYSSQDADSEGEEGRFFVFNPTEVESAVGADRAALMCEHFGVDEQGNFEHGRTVLSIAKTAAELAEAHGRPEAEIERELAEGRRAMFLARETRPRPGRDDKILAGWNALMIRGLASAGRAFDRPDWLEMATRAADFVLAKMLRGRDLFRSYKDGRARIDGLLEDYGDLVEALAVLYSATFEAGYLQAAAALADTALERFRDDASGAFLATPKSGEQLVAPVFSLHDNAWPSGASTLADGLVMLAGLTSRGEYLEAADDYLGRMRDQMIRAPSGFGHLLCAADTLLDGAATLVVAGANADARPLLADAARRYAPTVAVAWADPAREPAPILAETVEGKRPLNGRATAYLCRNFACQAPSTSADVLDAMGAAPAAP